MIRRLSIAGAVALAVAAPGGAAGADARLATLPAGVSEVPTIRAVYPALYAAELARKDGVSWERLRRAARTAWMRTHPCATATLARLYRLGARSSWDTMVATWRCGGMPEWRIRFLSCVADHEGGRAHPDVSYGGGRGFAPLRGNIVFGHNQLRPAWYEGARQGRPGSYLSDRWTYALYEWASHPVNQARAVAPLSASQYATSGLCS